MPWVVVKFLPSEEVEALPDLWFDKEKQMCLYPSYTRQKLEKAIKSQEKPESDWKKYNAKLLSATRYENFNIASAKASKACFTSDISDIEVLPEKRTIRKKVYSSEEVETDESLSDVPMLQTSSLGGANKNSVNYENEAAGQIMETHSYDDFRKVVITHQVKHSKMLKEVENTVNNLQLSLAENKDILIQILNIVSGKSTSTVMDATADVYSSKLPIKRIEDVDGVEKDLSEENNFKLLVKTFSRLGGTDYKDLIRRILTRTMTDEVMKLYSLHGHKGKKIYSETKLFSALTEAVKIFDNKVTIKEIEIKTSASLAKAAERLRNKK